MNSGKYIAKSFIWGAVAKIIDSVVKFVSLPLLLLVFGRENFGLITLALAANAYMNLLDLGINTGAVKYFAEWISKGKNDLLKSVAKTSITFYCIIGVLNAIILLFVAFFGVKIFTVSQEQIAILKSLFYVLAGFSIINWSTSVFNQLLTANEAIHYIHKISIVKSLANGVLIFITITYEISIIQYFFFYTLLNSLVFIPYYIIAKNQQLINSLGFGFDWVNFKTILRYSLSILALGIFQVSATALRPIILSVFTSNGVGIVTDYRVMETITLFIISIGGMFTTIFLPRVSKLLIVSNATTISSFAYTSTHYTSIICVYLCIPFILNSNEIISLYVGESYVHLSRWLVVWVVTILFFLHSTPVNSIILATGKTKLLVYITGFSCVVSLSINALLSRKLGSGSAVLGYSIYVGIQMSFYYFYFYRNILKIDPIKLFKSFIGPTFLGFICVGIIWAINLHFNLLIIQILIKSSCWTILYTAMLFITKQVTLKDIKQTLSDR